MSKFELIKEDPITAPTPAMVVADLKVLEEDPKEITRQLSLLDLELFKRITREELLSLAWSNPKEKYIKSPNIVEMTHRFNNIACWITIDILDATNVKRRINKICQFIRIAKHCQEIRNYNGLKCILSGLQNSAIHRLERTWAIVPKKEKDSFEKMAEAMSPDDNNKLYRKELSRQKLPCVPYLGIFLADLTFLLEAKNQATEDMEIQASIEKLLRNVEYYQKSMYPFNAVPKIQSFLRKDMFIPEMYPFFEEESFKKSLALEPKDIKPEPNTHVNNAVTPSASVFKRSHKYSSSDGVNWNELFKQASISDLKEIQDKPESNTSYHKRQSSAQQTRATRPEVSMLSAFKFKPLAGANVQGISSGSTNSNTNISMSSSLHSSLHSLPPSSYVVGEKSGPLKRKKELEGRKKAASRRWKDYWASLNPDGTFNLIKTSKGRQKCVSIVLTSESMVEEALDYKKRPNVIRLCPNQTESMLLQAFDIQEMTSWLIHFQSVILKLKPNQTKEIMDSEYDRFVSDSSPTKTPTTKRFYCYSCEEEVITSNPQCPYCKKDFSTI